MKTFTCNRQGWRALLLIPIAVMAVLSIVATGGSSGDGGDGFNGNGGVPDVPPNILSSYNFEIASTDSSVDVPMEVTVGSLGTVAVNFGNTILGSIDLDVSGIGEVTLLSTVTDAGSTMSITVESAMDPTLSGTVTLNVTQDITSGVFDTPDSGAFDLVSDLLGTISVTIGSTGVDLSLNGAPSVFYSWEEYTDLLDSETAEDWERVAALGGGAYEFIFERVYEAADVLDELEEVDLMGQIVEQCDAYRVAPPASVESVPGEVTLTQTGPTVYQAEFTDCWADSPFDTLLNGIIQLGPYLETVDASNNLTRIGFGPDAGTRGGVEFFGFTIEEAEESNGVFVIDPTNTIVVNGGFSLVFTAP